MTGIMLIVSSPPLRGCRYFDNTKGGGLIIQEGG